MKPAEECVPDSRIDACSTLACIKTVQTGNGQYVSSVLTPPYLKCSRKNPTLSPNTGAFPRNGFDSAIATCSCVSPG